MSVYLQSPEELQVPSLTAEELAWVKKLDKLLGQMPARLKLIECDDSLFVVDDDAAKAALNAEAQQGGFQVMVEAGAVLADVGNGTMRVSGMTN